ncbi:hypothetical protein [Nannocystis radixulma]|uniref:hypothetical protein n=1 Tax=Nannocystis radixulma TaxID=2995305 RepID=UPI002331113A|nr:hypothetical protein [Nannocystis radixulma]
MQKHEISPPPIHISDAVRAAVPPLFAYSLAKIAFGGVTRRSLSLLFALAFFGCDDSPPPSVEPTTPPPAPPPRAADNLDEYTSLCGGGEPFPAAKPYKKGATPADISRVVVFEKYKESVDPAWRHLTSAPIDAWSAEEPADVQLVACVELSKRQLRRSCEYKDSAGEQFKLDLYDMSHAVRVVEAATGKVVLEQTFELGNTEGCPAFELFGSSTSDYRGVDYKHKLMALLAPLQPEGARPPPPRDFFELARVCDGVAFPGTTRYDKSAAQKHPLYTTFRTDESAPLTLAAPPQGYDASESIGDPAAYQLVACVVGKSEKKRKDCRFDGGAVVELHEGTVEVAVYATATAELVEKKTFKATGGTCPMLFSFPDDTKRAAWLPKLAPAYHTYMAALVGP